MNKESLLQILHHNRDRTPILANFDTSFFGDTLAPSDKQSICLKMYLAMAALTPDDDTTIDFKSAIGYLNVKREPNNYVYNYYDLIDSLDSSIRTSANLTDDTRNWLVGRGVTEEQIVKFEIHDNKELTSIKDRICLGVSVHPYLQDWIGQEWPEGCWVPVRRLDTTAVGTYSRFLSTVPKIKFSAAIPGAYCFTNLWDGRPVTDIYLVEGIFDGMAVDRAGKHFISPSSGFMLPEQLFVTQSLLNEFRDAKVYAAFDNDRVGSKNNCVFKQVFSQVQNVRYPEDVKDMSELICKNGGSLSDLVPITYKDALKLYNSFPYGQIIQYDHYLDHRQASYSNDNYNWSDIPFQDS